MTGFLLALILTQTAKPAAWMVVPQASVAKIDATPLRAIFLTLDKPPSGDTTFVAYDGRGNAHIATLSEETSIKDTFSRTGAEQIAPQADFYVGADLQQLVSIYAPMDGHFDVTRAAQRLGFDKLPWAIGGAKLVGKDALHVDALASYPPPRSGFVEAFGPSAPAVIPANAPQADAVTMVSVRPSAVFNQANTAFAAASPVDQALFFTHLRGLESQLGKRFADDALGTTPRVWSFYARGAEGVSVLEVASVSLVKAFLDRYVDALAALAPGSKVERVKIGKREGLAVTLPSKETFAIAFDTNALVIAPSHKALTAHFASKGRGKATTLAGNAIAWGTAGGAKGSASYTMTLANEGFKIAADAKAKK